MRYAVVLFLVLVTLSGIYARESIRIQIADFTNQTPFPICEDFAASLKSVYTVLDDRIVIMETNHDSFAMETNIGPGKPYPPFVSDSDENRDDIYTISGVIRFQNGKITVSAGVFKNRPGWLITSDEVFTSDTESEAGIQTCVSNLAVRLLDKLLWKNVPEYQEPVIMKNETRTEEIQPAISLQSDAGMENSLPEYRNYRDRLFNFSASYAAARNEDKSVDYFSINLGYQTRWFHTCYAGLDLGYGNCNSVYTASYNYTLNLFRLIPNICYRLYVFSPLYVEAYLGAGVFTGSIQYHSSLTNVTSMVWGGILLPKIGIGYQFGNMVVTMQFAFDTSALMFDKYSYQLSVFSGSVTVGYSL